LYIPLVHARADIFFLKSSANAKCKKIDMLLFSFFWNQKP
jgi:hypothetical protein